MTIEPTAEQARFYAAAVEAGIPGPVAVQAVLPEVPDEHLPVLAEKWERTREVRAARFDVREWLQKGTAELVDFALTKTRHQMAAYLATHNVATLKDAALTKALKFIEVLEKVQAGTAGKGDAASQFFADVVAGKIKLGHPSGVAH